MSILVANPVLALMISPAKSPYGRELLEVPNLACGLFSSRLDFTVLLVTGALAFPTSTERLEVVARDTELSLAPELHPRNPATSPATTQPKTDDVPKIKGIVSLPKGKTSDTANNKDAVPKVTDAKATSPNTASSNGASLKGSSVNNIANLKPMAVAKTAQAPAGDLVEASKAYETVLKKPGIQNKQKRALEKRTKLEDFLNSRASKSAKIALQHQSVGGDTATAYVGTVGLTSCSAVVYASGTNVVIGHFFPTDDGVVDGTPLDGNTRNLQVSLPTQVSRFKQALTDSGLSGTEANGRWVFVHPVNDQDAKLYWGAHGRIATWAKELAGAENVQLTPYLLTPAEMQTHAQTNMQNGLGVVYAIRGKVYYGNTKISESGVKRTVWSRILNSSS
ncbi:hypothetical protein B0O99DRAFT_671796 [Bisporella sp. PMI_857]|nr:hypothetical protein B0O99DRAFT_671796 [Bisporella sp. PMI_857]